MKRFILAIAVTLALFAAIPTVSYAGDVRQIIDVSQTTVATSSASLFAANKQRQFLFIQNTGTVDVWVNFAGTASVGGSGCIKLTPGASMTYESGTIPKNAVTIIADTSTGKVTAYEG